MHVGEVGNVPEKSMHGYFGEIIMMIIEHYKENLVNKITFIIITCRLEINYLEVED